MAKESNLGDVSARLGLDTSAFDAGMKQAMASVEPTARAIEKAAKKSADAQATAAKYAADKVTDEGRRILAARNLQSDSARDLGIVQSAMKRGYLDEAAGASAAVAAIQRQVAAQKELRDLSSQNQGYTQQMAASAAIRSLSGNPGIRSVERFIDLSPKVARVVSGLFPLIGAAGLAGLLYDMGEKGYAAFTKVQNAAANTREAFEDAHEKAQLTTDDLAIENQRIQDQIDKLSGHPNNGLALALDEARKMADKLLDSLQADRKALDALLKENEIGAFGSLIGGVSATAGQDKQILQDQKNLTEEVRKANRDYKAAVKETADPKELQAALEKRNKTVHDALQKQIDGYGQESKRLQSEQAKSEAAAAKLANDPYAAAGGIGPAGGKTIDNSAKIANIDGYREQLQDRQANEDYAESIYGGNVKLGKLKQDKGSGNKAAEELLHHMQQQREAEEQLGATSEQNRGLLSAQADKDFWTARIDQFKAGSSEFLEVYRKITEDEKSIQTERLEWQRAARKKAVELMNLPVPKEITDNAAGRMYAKDLSNLSKADAARSDAANQLMAVEQRNHAALEELGISERVGRSITQQAAALQIAAIHAAAYGDEIDRLNKKADEIRKASYLTDAEKEKQLGSIAIQGSTLETSRAEQMMRDNAATARPDTSAAVGAKDALDQFTNASLDAAKAIQELTSTTLSSVNKAIVDDLTTGGGNRYKLREQWTNVGRGVFTDATGSLLKRGEGSLLNSFGIGSKAAPKGTASDPLHVVLANLTAQAPISASISGDMSRSSSDLGKLLYGDSGPAAPNVSSLGSSSSAPGFFSKLLKFSVGLLPHFADGGAVSAGTLAMVGERGPELAYFGSGGHVTPNHKLVSAGGGDTHHTWNIDARGSTNPAETMAMVQRGIIQAAPHIIAATQKSMQSNNARRNPASRG
jgi:hypothetical protein